jgi:multimeric flavodoxin WrbA
MSRNILLLIGSAKKEQSNSESLGTYLVEKLQQKGFEAETLFVHRAVKDADKFIEAVDKADLIILASPLYVDSLPYSVIKGMEQIAEYRKNQASDKKQSFAAIINCGFPEAHQNNTAIAICRRFAKEAGFNWAGGLRLGGGEAIGGKPLAGLGFMVRNVMKSLDIVAQDIADGKPISEKAVQLMAKPLMPRWLYCLIGDIMTKKHAKEHGVHKNLSDCPYQAG